VVFIGAIQIHGIYWCTPKPLVYANLLNLSIISNILLPSRIHFHKKNSLSLLSRHIPSVHNILDFKGSLYLSPPIHPYMITLYSFHSMASSNLKSLELLFTRSTLTHTLTTTLDLDLSIVIYAEHTPKIFSTYPNIIGHEVSSRSLGSSLKFGLHESFEMDPKFLIIHTLLAH
jgi:hypothetical protein